MIVMLGDSSKRILRRSMPLSWPLRNSSIVTFHSQERRSATRCSKSSGDSVMKSYASQIAPFERDYLPIMVIERVLDSEIGPMALLTGSVPINGPAFWDARSAPDSEKLMQRRLLRNRSGATFELPGRIALN